jgi:hypothetical protein
MPNVLPGTLPLFARDESEYGASGKRNYEPYRKRPATVASLARKAHPMLLQEKPE